MYEVYQNNNKVSSGNGTSKDTNTNINATNINAINTLNATPTMNTPNTNTPNTNTPNANTNANTPNTANNTDKVASANKVDTVNSNKVDINKNSTKNNIKSDKVTFKNCVINHIRKKYAQRNQLDIICEGLMLGHSGFANAMRNISYQLSKTEEVRAVVLDPPEPSIAASEVGKKIIEMTHRNDIGTIDPCFYIGMNIPLGIGSHLGTYNIAYIMFETVEFPQIFTEHLKRIGVNEIWTPCNFCRDSMIKSGLPGTMVKTMPLGVDTNLFNPKTVDEPKYVYGNLNEYKDKYKFLTVMGYSERKGIGTLIRAYTEEFDGQDDVALIVKGGWYDKNLASHEIMGMTAAIARPPPIHLDFNIYPDNVIASLYKACDCFVLPSKGEGYGLPYNEAMSMELPTVGTKSSAMLDFMTDENSYLIDVERYATEPKADWITPLYIGQKFAHPSKDHLKKILRHIYENRQEAKQKGIQARKDMVQNYDWTVSCKRMTNRLMEIINETNI